MLEVLEPDGYAEHLNCLDRGDHRGWEWLSSLGCQQGYHGETRVALWALGLIGLLILASVLWIPAVAICR